MKVGKESIAGAMAALEAWAQRDHAGVRARERGHLELWRERLGRLPGLDRAIVPDPTDNPLDRLEVQVDPAEAGTTAWALAAALAAGRPAGHRPRPRGRARASILDPCNLHPGEADGRGDYGRNVGGHPRPAFAHDRRIPAPRPDTPAGMAGLSGVA